MRITSSLLLIAGLEKSVELVNIKQFSACFERNEKCSNFPSYYRKLLNEMNSTHRLRLFENCEVRVRFLVCLHKKTKIEILVSFV